MSRVRLFVQYWLPVLLWMAIIFAASSDRASFQHSSAIVEPILRWLFPGISAEVMHWSVLLVRKAAHLTEYAILAALVWRLLRRLFPSPAGTWSLTNAQGTLLWTVLYAASDEFHQRFVPSRQASIGDVLIDSAGGFLALLLIWVVGRWRRRW